MAEFAPDAIRFQLSDAHDAYYYFLADMWAAGQGFTVIEQDVEIHAGVVEEFESCPEPWCARPYVGAGIGKPEDSLLYIALGCTRFSTALIQAVPNLMADLPVRDWRRLDCHIAPALREAGYEPHHHYPIVKHHHAYHPHPERCSCGELRSVCTPGEA